MSKEEFVNQYTYLDKTILEWEQLSKDTNTLDKEGNPQWMEYLANATYGAALAKILYENLNKDEDE